MSETVNILVVDDEAGMRQGSVRALTGFTVTVPDVNGEVVFVIDQAESGEQALEKIAAAAPDILLLDHKLPGISGLDVLDRIASREDKIATIMITAYASLESAVTAIKHGAYDFLAKPFTPAELKLAIRKAAESVVLARQARQLAADKRRVRFQFISVLAHELKAPLAAIQGYLTIMKDRAAGDDPKVYDHMIERSLVRVEGMHKLIMDLLDLTRIESGQKRRELKPLDVREVAQAAIDTTAPEALRRGITVTLCGDAPAAMMADRGEIEIILNNLVSNAVKYNRAEGQVRVSVTADGQWVRIEVADTGVGMTAEECQRLFHDFVRIKNERTRNVLGSGLGLSIVKKLAGLYGGDAAVTSQPDVGSTFTVTLRPHAAGEGEKQSG